VCNNGIVKLEFDPSSLINLQVLYLSKNQIKDIVIVS
jgi:Leucine-rich repeat (LRR) protein